MHSNLFHDISAIKVLLDALPVAVFVKDAESKFLLMNRACEAQWGINISDLEGTDASQFFPPDQMEWFLAKDGEIFAGGCQVDFEETAWNAALKQNRIYHTFKKPTYDESGTPLSLICVSIDITESKKSHQDLLSSEEKLRETMATLHMAQRLAGIGNWEWDAQTGVHTWSEEIYRIYGRDLKLPPAIYPDVQQYFTPESWARLAAAVGKGLADGIPYECDAEVVRSDGTRRWITARGEASRDAGGQISGLHGTIQDITRRKLAEIDLQIAEVAFEAQLGIMVTDASSVILRVNSTFTEQSGYSVEELVGQTPRLLKSGRHDADFYAAMRESLKLTGSWEGEIWDRRKNGEIYPKWMTIKSIRSEQGEITHYVGTQIDITERKISENVINNLAFYDPLTQLPNRRLLQERLHQALATIERSRHCGAILFIDLDNFKVINDTLGHVMGDGLLQQVAERLTSCVREGDTVARIGGDEFVVMLEGLSNTTLEAAAQAEAIGEKILATLRLPYHLGIHEHHNFASIGVALFSDQQQGSEDLFKQADIAMYQAKKAGRNQLRFFDPEMQDSINTRVALESELRKALENHQFHLHYQIQVDNSHRPHGAEVLIRWMHPERGLVSPAQFIPLAEETGLILPIGQWVLETACAQIKAWEQETLTGGLVLAVNVSAIQFYQADFATQVQAAVQRHGIDPTRLKLELTESMLLENIEGTIATMNALKEIGVRLSLDDFGTGYSSLQYLKQLPLDQLKIDQSFVRDLVVDSSDKAIVSTIIAMADSFSLDVIAEGVETEEQRQILLNAGCLHFQGFLFSKPVPLEQFETLLKQS